MSSLDWWGSFAPVLPIVGFALLTLLARVTRGRWSTGVSRRSETEAHRAQTSAAVTHVLTHDSLTSLPNRLLLEDRLRQAILQADRHGRRFAVLVINLDRFKSINDSLGRDVGDQLLVEVGARLAKTVREVDTLARHGGDEFVLIVTDVTDVKDARVAAGRILECLAHPLRVGATDIYPDVSIGVSLYPDNGGDVNTLLVHGNAAMSHAKKLGGRQVQFFDPSMNGCTRERHVLTNELRNAVLLKQLELHYQPKVDIATGEVREVEALVRWRHPERGLLTPGAFLPLAEETGLIVPVSEWVLTEACRQVALWHQVHHLRIRVAVNLSAQQFGKHNIVECVKRSLDEAHLSPRFLQLELTESAIIVDPERAADTLRQLRRMGVFISIDDFGVNCSCLSYLRLFQIDELKIDLSFVRTMMEDAVNGAIVRAIISLAHGLGLRVVAEGVETPEQMRVLAQLRCDQYQGWLCSAALPADDLVKFIRNRRRQPIEIGQHPSYGRAVGQSRPLG